MQKSYFRLLLIMMVMAVSWQGLAKAPLVIDPGVDEYLLDAHLQLLEDPQDSITSQDILTRWDDFHFEDRIKIMRDRESHPYWIRFDFHNPTSEPIVRYLFSYSPENPYFQSYLVVNGRLEANQPFGYKVPPAERGDYNFRPIVPLTLPPNQTTSFIVKAKFHRLNVMAYRLLAYKKANYYNFINWGIVAMYSGCVVALVIYNFFLYLRLREPSYLYYILFALGMFSTFYALTGIFDLWWLGFGKFYWVELGMGIMGLVPIAATFFMRNFLQTSIYAPRLDKALNWYIALLVTIVVVVLSFPNQKVFILNDVANLSSLTLVMVCSVIAIRRGYKPAKIYLASWALFIVSVVYWTLGQQGVLENSFFNANATLLGNMGEMILMSLALAQKIKLLQEEKAEAEVKAAEGEATRKLLHVVCHDVANPLTVIMGAENYLNSLSAKEDFNPPERVGREFNRIARATDMIKDIIDNVKRFESSRSGKAEVNLEPVLLSEVVEQVEFIFASRFEKKDLAFKAELGDYDGSRVLAEKTSLCHDVVNNIVSNSIKFSSRGGVISFRSQVVNDKVHITIRDQGIGMPQNLIPKLFEPDAKTSRPGTEKEAGTGFGMPLVKSYVQQYGGEIQVESVEKGEDSPDHGTAITIILKAA